MLAASLRPGTGTFLLLAATAGAAMAVRAFGGHAGGSVVEGTLQTLHFAAVGAWVGGLTWLVVGVRRGAEPVAGAPVLHDRGDRARRPGRDRGPPGVERARRVRPGGSTRSRPSYGTALVVKLAIVAGLVALGAVNRYRNVRRYEELGRAPLLRTVGGELVPRRGVLAVTGVLTGLAPQGAATAPAPHGRAAARRERVRLRDDDEGPT